MAFSSSVMGLFSTQAQVTTVVSALCSVGFGKEDVSILFPEPRGASRPVSDDEQQDSREATAMAGVGAGGAFGGTLGLLLGVAAMAIPGLGIVAAAGPIVGALTGAAAGAAVGGLAGHLIGMGIPETHARHYEGKIGSGSIFVAVHVGDDAALDRARDILLQQGGLDVATTNA
jgi:hypothetical protein